MTEIDSHTLPDLDAARQALTYYAKRIEENPQANSVQAYAHELFQKIETGQINLTDFEALVHTVFCELIEQRADRFRAQHKVEADDPWADVRARLDTIAAKGWDVFRQTLETAKGGIVFTGHPTFALSQTARSGLAHYISAPDDANRADLHQSLKADNRLWEGSITLPGEHAEAQAALQHAQTALSAYVRLVYDVAETAFPDTWQNLRPQLPTLASWLGYDLDGRTDIHWSQSFAFRLSEKAVQMDRYARRISEMMPLAQGKTLTALEELQSVLEAACAQTEKEAAAFGQDLTDPQTLVTAAHLLTTPHQARLIRASLLTEKLDALLACETCSEALLKEGLILRAEIETLKLGTARIHLRLNAAQIGTVINRDLGLETEQRDPGRGALRKLSELAATCATYPINFADLFLQQSTARRQFMMCAQLLKHVDADSTIRFLIAESENPATVMGALYLARQYGVSEQLDISPLFETPEALETGGRFMEQLLAEPVYLDYLRKRGYVAIQLGFSDAGRFIGQVAADMAIERIHNLISRAVCHCDAELELLIFNTHGESMGRGAWPGDFKARFDHLLTPWTRQQSARRGVALRHEVSFQGGDGFLHFANEALASATLAAFSAHLLSEPDEQASDDPFYTRTDLVWDFYRALRQWHERLFENPDYGSLLNDFATGFLVKAGSRQRRRSSGPQGPRALRAISHNATLQQIGVPLNTAAGIGSAMRREQDQVVELIRTSPRMRHLIRLAAIAREKTSVPALRAYASVFDPSLWVALSRAAGAQHKLAYRRIYYLLQNSQTNMSFESVANILSIDLSKFDPMLAEIESVPSVAQRHQSRLNIHVLHAIRQALMMKALALAGRLPTVSRRHEDSVLDIMNLIKAMQIGSAVDILREIFPASRGTEAQLEAMREPGHLSGMAANGYDELHAEIIGPLDQIDMQLRQITLALAQAYGAYG